MERRKTIEGDENDLNVTNNPFVVSAGRGQRTKKIELRKESRLHTFVSKRTQAVTRRRLSNNRINRLANMARNESANGMEEWNKRLLFVEANGARHEGDVRFCYPTLTHQQSFSLN